MEPDGGGDRGQPRRTKTALDGTGEALFGNGANWLGLGFGRPGQTGFLRIAFRLSPKGVIEVVAIGPRKAVYEETFRLTSENSR